MTTTPRAATISRLVGNILGTDHKDAATGWTARGEHPGTVLITLNYGDTHKDQAAAEKIIDALGARYALHYTPVLNDYSGLPEALYGCAVIDVRTLPATAQEPTVPAEPTVTVTLPGKFCDWFDGTGLVQGQDDDDPECKVTREAYKAGTLRRNANGYSIKITTSDDTVLRLLREYADTCVDSIVNGDPNPAELRAARTVIARTLDARKALKTAQEAHQAQQDAPTAPLADWERETLANAHQAPTTPRDTTADENIGQGDQRPRLSCGHGAVCLSADGTTCMRCAAEGSQEPQTPAHAPASVWVTTAHGDRIEYAHIPNGDPVRVDHFLTAARNVPAYTDVSTQEAPTAPVTGESDPYPAHNTQGRCAHGTTCRYHRPDPNTPGAWIHPDADHTPCTITAPGIHVTWTGTVKGHHHATVTLPGGRRARITYIPRSDAHTFIGRASMGNGSPIVARAHSLSVLLHQYAQMSGYQTFTIEEYGTPDRPATAADHATD